MRLPKFKISIFSNVLYVLLASTLSLLVFYDAAEAYGFSPLVSLIAFAVLSLLGLLLYKLLSYTSGLDFFKTISDRGRYITVVIFVFLMASSVVFRCLTYMWSGLGGNAYFEVAKVSGEAVPHYVHPADEIYVQLLHAVFFLFGNRIYVAAIVNCVLQIIGVCLGFIAFRKLLGNIAALSFAGFWSITGFSVHEALTLNSRSIVFLFVMICVFAISRSVPAREGKFISFVFAGITAAFCVYLDISGLVLIPFLAGEIFFDKGNEGSPFSLRFVKSLISILSAVFGFILIVIVDGLVSSANPFNIISAICSRYFPASDFILGFSYMTSYSEVLILAVLVSLGIFSSFFSDDDTRGVLLFSTVIILLINNFGLTYLENDGRCLLFTFAALFAGISLRELFPAEFKGDVFGAGSNVDNDVSYPDEGYVPAGLSDDELVIFDDDTVIPESADAPSVPDPMVVPGTAAMPDIMAVPDTAAIPDLVAVPGPAGFSDFSSATPGGNVPYDISAFDAVDIKASTNIAEDGPDVFVSGDDNKTSLDHSDNDSIEGSMDAEKNAEETLTEEKPKRAEYVYTKPQLKPEWRRRPGGWVPPVSTTSDEVKTEIDDSVSNEIFSSDSSSNDSLLNAGTPDASPFNGTISNDDDHNESFQRVDENGVVLLDNPIPHPERKTQHRPMEFENAVSDSDMDFDVSVSDEDDFDV